MNAFENCGFVKQFRHEYGNDPHRYEHCLSSSKPEKKIQAFTEFELMTSATRCSALPTELTSQLEAGYYFLSSVHKCEDRFHIYFLIRRSHL